MTGLIFAAFMFSAGLSIGFVLLSTFRNTKETSLQLTIDALEDRHNESQAEIASRSLQAKSLREDLEYVNSKLAEEVEHSKRLLHLGLTHDKEAKEHLAQIFKLQDQVEQQKVSVDHWKEQFERVNAENKKYREPYMTWDQVSEASR